MRIFISFNCFIIRTFIDDPVSLVNELCTKGPPFSISRYIYSLCFWRRDVVFDIVFKIISVYELHHVKGKKALIYF